MLTIHRVGRGGAGYYLSDLGWELPVATPARWVGTASAAMGLDGGLGGGAGFGRMFAGLQPLTGGRLGSGRTQVAAFDLTFSAPKSCSVLFGLGGDDVAGAVVAAQERAVAAAVKYLEQHAVTVVRRRRGEAVVLPAAGMLAARFVHGVNRNGDPHLHTHVVMANLVHGADGRWSACDGRGVDAHRRAAAAVYEAHLRSALTSALGVRWSAAAGRVPEVAGMAPQLIGEFSSRRADILRQAHDAGARRGGGSRVAWAATRRSKEHAPPYPRLAAEWRRRARVAGGLDGDGGIEVSSLRHALRGGPGARGGLGRGALDEHRFAAEISLTPHGGARRRDVVCAFAGAAVDGIGQTALERLVDVWVPGGAVGVGEPLYQRRAVVPAPHLLHVLGPRPLDPHEHGVWLGAARAVEVYRSRWGLQHDLDPLGAATPRELASLPAARLADHVRTLHRLREARARLGRRGPAGPWLGLER